MLTRSVSGIFFDVPGHVERRWPLRRVRVRLGRGGVVSRVEKAGWKAGRAAGGRSGAVVVLPWGSCRIVIVWRRGILVGCCCGVLCGVGMTSCVYISRIVSCGARGSSTKRRAAGPQSGAETGPQGVVG